MSHLMCKCMAGVRGWALFFSSRRQRASVFFTGGLRPVIAAQRRVRAPGASWASSAFVHIEKSIIDVEEFILGLLGSSYGGEATGGSGRDARRSDLIGEEMPSVQLVYFTFLTFTFRLFQSRLKCVFMSQKTIFL